MSRLAAEAHASVQGRRGDQHGAARGPGPVRRAGLLRRAEVTGRWSPTAVASGCGSRCQVFAPGAASFPRERGCGWPGPCGRRPTRTGRRCCCSRPARARSRPRIADPGVEPAAAIDPRGRSAHRPAPAALVPALVDGDDAALPERTVAEFQTAGLTHLLAVSGTNLTLIVGGLLALARSCGVRARALVGRRSRRGGRVRAAAGTGAQRAPGSGDGNGRAGGLGHRGASRGLGGWASAVWLLLLVDPWLARSVGFRAVGAAPPPGSCCWPRVAGRAAALDAALGRRGDRRPGRGPAGLHAAGGGCLRAGEPGRGRREPDGRAAGRPDHGARPARRTRSGCC